MKLSDKPFTKEELAWARRTGKKLGIKDPEVFLNMRWSEASKLAAELGLDVVANLAYSASTADLSSIGATQQ